MDKSIFARLYLLLILFILIGGCAKISAPSGGLRDRIPPVVIKSIPANGALNFTGKSIAITFDEYVVLDNINDKFMVSPPMKKKPRVFLKGKSVNVEFEDKLKDSTTYTFNFQDAIKDLNEGNILENYQFVFSTGPVIDSLSVTGNVYNALNLEVPEKTQVLMYSEMADSAVVKHLPDYISRVGNDGYFRIDNVRSGNYMLYALKDDDNSKNYNSIEEEFAFMNSPVIISPEKNFLPIVKDTTKLKTGENKVSQSTSVKKTADKVPDPALVKKGVVKIAEPEVKNGEYQLFLFKARKKAHYLIKSSRDLKYQMTYILSLPPGSMKFDFSIPGSSAGSYFTERSRNNDTLKVWLADSTIYSQQQIETILNYPFTDTLGTLGYKEDTIPMRFITPRAPRVTKVKKPVLTLETNISGGSLKPGQSIVFNSKTPLRQPDTAQIKLYELINTNRKTIRYSFIKDSLNSCRYILSAGLLPVKKYLLITDTASFSNIYNEYSDSTGTNFSVRDPETYSKLTLDIKNYEGNRIIQLLNQQEKLIRQEVMKKDGKLVFPLLESGFYRIRVIYDLNGDGEWTTGDFDSGRQPEPVSYFQKEMEMKTGWDSDETWDIGIKNIKDQKLKEKRKN